MYRKGFQALVGSVICFPSLQFRRETGECRRISALEPVPRHASAVRHVLKLGTFASSRYKNGIFETETRLVLMGAHPVMGEKGVSLRSSSAAPPQPEVHDATRGEGGAVLSSVGSLQRSPRPSSPRAPPTSRSRSPGPREIARAVRRFSEVVDQGRGACGVPSPGPTSRAIPNYHDNETEPAQPEEAASSQRPSRRVPAGQITALFWNRTISQRPRASSPSHCSKHARSARGA